MNRTGLLGTAALCSVVLLGMSWLGAFASIWVRRGSILAPAGVDRLLEGIEEVTSISWMQLEPDGSILGWRPLVEGPWVDFPVARYRRDLAKYGDTHDAMMRLIAGLDERGLIPAEPSADEVTSKDLLRRALSAVRASGLEEPGPVEIIILIEARRSSGDPVVLFSMTDLFGGPKTCLEALLSFAGPNGRLRVDAAQTSLWGSGPSTPEQTSALLVVVGAPALIVLLGWLGFTVRLWRKPRSLRYRDVALATSLVAVPAWAALGVLVWRYLPEAFAAPIERFTLVPGPVALGGSLLVASILGALLLYLRAPAAAGEALPSESS